MSWLGCLARRPLVATAVVGGFDSGDGASFHFPGSSAGDASGASVSDEGSLRLSLTVSAGSHGGGGIDDIAFIPAAPPPPDAGTTD